MKGWKGMGATTFSNVYIGKSTPEGAFNELRTNQGNTDGYSGTIAEKQSILIIDCEKGKDPEKQADELIVKNENDVCDKWGPCGCIEYKRSFLKKLKDKNPNLKGKKGIRAYLFFGWSPC